MTAAIAAVWLSSSSSSSSTSSGVAAFSLMANPYQEPVKGQDGRSPCPALNTLANHGFIPRNGMNISANSLAVSAAEAFSISEKSAGFVVEKMISIGLPHRIDEVNSDILFDLEDTRVTDHDLSVAWLDNYFRTVQENSPCLVKTLIDRAGDEDYITPDHIEANLRARFDDSRLYNPNFKFTEYVLPIAAVQSAEFFVVSDDPNLERVNKTVLQDFLLHNKFSDGYVPRATTNPFQPKLDATDPSALLIARYTAVLEELVASYGVDGRIEGGVAIQRAASTNSTSDGGLSSSTKPMCVDEQPPAPPTLAPAPTMTPVVAPVVSASAGGTARVISLLVGVTASAVVAMMVTMQL